MTHGRAECFVQKALALLSRENVSTTECSTYQFQRTETLVSDMLKALSRHISIRLELPHVVG
jgi:hypothetical protein